MSGRTHARVWALTALLAVGAFGFATFAASGPHTDDGCAVELHCFACRWAITSTAIVDAGAHPLVVLEAAGAAPPSEPHDLVEIRSLETSARGPPFVPFQSAV